MTDANDVLMGQGARKDPTALVARDQWGRYLIPDPDTGVEKAWTRVTTLVDALEDKHGLNKWDQRNIVWGIGHDEGLYARAAAASKDDKDDLGSIAWAAMQAAGSKKGANLGTALHRFAERIDLGEMTAADVPAAWRKDMVAYAKAMAAGGVTIVPEWTERIVVFPALSCAGTMDRLVKWMDLLAVGDIKSGRIDLGILKIAMQLACYANATHWYDPVERVLHEITDPIRKDVAVIAHLPAGEGVCTLHGVDIAVGLEGAQEAYKVREDLRKRKGLSFVIASSLTAPEATPAAPPQAAPEEGVGEAAPPVTGAAPTPVDPDEEAAHAEAVAEQGIRDAAGDAVADGPASAERIAWLKRRVHHLYGLGFGANLEARWLTTTVPVPLSDDYTDQQVSYAASWCDAVEADKGVDFGETDPLFAVFMAEQAEERAEREAEAERQRQEAGPPESEAVHWTAMARSYMDGFSDADVLAVATAAGMTPGDSRMTAQRFDHVCAIVDEMSEPDGGLVLCYDAGGARVDPSTTAADRMMAATAADGKLTKTAALTRAKAVAKSLGLPAPKGLAQAAEVPLLVALVAQGKGLNTNTNQESQ